MARQRKPMSDDVKRKLRESADANRGRKTLAGIDPLGWAGAIDTVLASDAPKPRVELYASGTLNGPDPVTGKEFMPLFFKECKCRWYGRETEGDYSHRVRCSWVRLTRTRPGLEDDLERAFGCRWIDAYIFGGPGAGTVRRATRVFRVEDVVAVFRVVWPKQWPAMFKKYAVGCSPVVVERQARDPLPPPAPTVET